jgi:antitoxin component of MazEF toxin-antitoxin module
MDRERGIPATVGKRVKLPLVACAHEAQPGDEMIPERMANVLLDELLADVHPSNLHGETDWGPPVGQEIW